MKKSIIIIGLLLMFSMSGIAQNFGVQGGGMAANVRYRDNMYSLNTRVKPAFLVGVTLEFPIKTTMAVNTALNYKWVGAAFFGDSTDIHALQLGYVNLDLTFNYIFDMVTTVKPFVEGGGYAAYLTNATQVDIAEDGSYSNSSINIGTAVTDDIKPWDAGFTIGGGVYINKWKFGAGYQASFMNLSPQKDLYLWNKMGYLKATYFFGKKANRKDK